MVPRSFLVTGGTGFIGQRLIESIDGNIKVLGRTQHPTRNTIICDLYNSPIPFMGFLKNVDTVFHLAGVSHDVHDSLQEEYYQKVNIDATINLAKMSAELGVKKFIFLSSVKAGGTPPLNICASEEQQFCFDGLYGETKREAELQLLEIGKKSDMKVAVIRSSLVYGPNVKGNLQSMFLAIKQGWFPPLPEIGNKRSMIHIDDLVQAILLVANDERSNGEVFIATDGVPHSSRDIYNAMCNALGKKNPKWSVPKKLFDIGGLISPHIKHKINKLFGSECYSATKLEVLGFKTKKTLRDINEADF